MPSSPVFGVDLHGPATLPAPSTRHTEHGALTSPAQAAAVDTLDVDVFTPAFLRRRSRDERVVIFDGAFGTYVQDPRPRPPTTSADPTSRAATRSSPSPGPTSSPRMHDRVPRRSASTSIETATFGAFSVPLGEYDIADRVHEINLAAARIAREVARATHADRPRVRRRLHRARHHVRAASARSPTPSCATPTRPRRPRCSRAASTCSSSRPCSTCSGPRRR